MTKRHGPGVFTTLLLLVPMLAVPVMALFGVPHFMPVVASPLDRQNQDISEQYRETRVSQSEASLRPVSLRMETETVDLFQPYTAPDTTAATEPGPQEATQLDQYRQSWTDPLHDSRNRNHTGGWTAITRPERDSSLYRNVQTPASGPVTQHAGSSDGPNGSGQPPSAPRSGFISSYERQGSSPHVPSAAPLPGQSLNWRQAARAMEQLGVSTFSLSPGLNPGEFRFVCLVSSTDNPRISRRFESNSHDPLAAVEQVIDQVRNWAGPHPQ